MSIIGGSDREVAVHRALSVEADAAATTCDGRSAKDSGVEYLWQIYHLTDWSNTGANPTAKPPLVDVKSTSKNPKFFKLDANALEAGEVYGLRAVVTDSVTGLNNTAADTQRPGAAVTGCERF